MHLDKKSILAKKDDWIFRLLKFLLAACLFLPLLVSSAVIFPYTAPKAFAFRILVELAAVFYFYLVLKNRSFLSPLKKGGWGGFLRWAVLIFLTVYFLSAIFGVDFYLSWWGNLERMLGIWGMIHFVLFFLMLGAVFQTKKDWHGLLKISVGVSSAVALLAIVQKFTSIGLLIAQTGRVFGTIGNPAFLASYLIFNIFLAGYLILESKGIKCWLSVVSGGLLVVGLLLSGTRGAFLGLAVGVLMCLLFLGLGHPQKNWRKYFLTSLILLAVLVGLLFAFRQSAFVQKNSVLQRFVSISWKETTAQNRLILWQHSWQAWRERPMLGWGPENYEVAANKYFDSRLAPYEAWYDRAHNFIFDYGVAEGWLGLISYLSIFGIAFRYLKKTIKENFYFSVIFGSCLTAYLVQNLFVFDTFVSYLMLFFILAMINFVYQSNRPLVPSRATERVEVVPISAARKILLAVFSIVIIFSIYFFSLKPIQASHLASQALSLAPENWQKVEPILKQALSLNTFASPEIVYQTTLDYLAKADAAPQLTQNENFYTVAAGELQRIIEHSGVQSRNYVALAWLELYFSDRHRERIESAIVLAQKARELAPVRKDAYLILVAAYSVSNQADKALTVVQETEKISPDLGQAVREYWGKIK